MTKKKTNEPEMIEDKDLDETSGGLPAVQKVREAGATTTSETSAHSGGANFAMCDGSVRLV